jgi:hypothetical protein
MRRPLRVYSVWVKLMRVMFYIPSFLAVRTPAVADSGHYSDKYRFGVNADALGSRKS